MDHDRIKAQLFHQVNAQFQKLLNEAIEAAFRVGKQMAAQEVRQQIVESLAKGLGVSKPNAPALSSAAIEAPTAKTMAPKGLREQQALEVFAKAGPDGRVTAGMLAEYGGMMVSNARLVLDKLVLSGRALKIAPGVYMSTEAEQQQRQESLPLPPETKEAAEPEPAPAPEPPKKPEPPAREAIATPEDIAGTGTAKKVFEALARLGGTAPREAIAKAARVAAPQVNDAMRKILIPRGYAENMGEGIYRLKRS